MTPEGRRLLFLVVGVGLATFIVGYAVTALSFSRGRSLADVVMVPDVRELPIDEARRRMSEVGLGLAVGDSLPNPSIAEGAVLAQTPLPGQEVSPGTDVRVIVSSGRPRPTVPELEAMPLPLALRTLETAGFDVVVEEAPGEGEPGRVVGVNPAPGTPLPLPATVVVRVGTGMTESAVPSVIGMLETEARDALEAAGFAVDDIVYEQSEFGEPGGVLGQDPAPGELVPEGTPVTLRVAYPRTPTSSPMHDQEGRPAPSLSLLSGAAAAGGDR